jgi:hypothetical protein
MGLENVSHPDDPVNGESSLVVNNGLPPIALVNNPSFTSETEPEK